MQKSMSIHQLLDWYVTTKGKERANDLVVLGDNLTGF